MAFFVFSEGKANLENELILFETADKEIKLTVPIKNNTVGAGILVAFIGIKTVLPINLLFLLLFVQLVYVGIRWYVKGWRETREYYLFYMSVL